MAEEKGKDTKREKGVSDMAIESRMDKNVRVLSMAPVEENDRRLTFTYIESNPFIEVEGVKFLIAECPILAAWLQSIAKEE